MNFYTKKLSSELWKDFEAYFEYQGSCSGCWCMNHRLPMGLDFEGEAAKLAMKQLIQSNRVFGILAYVDEDSIPVGWASLDRKQTLPGHDCIGHEIDCRSSIWSIHCVTSRKDFKSKGVEKLLVEQAVALAEDLNASEVEAYPEPGSREGEEFKTWNSFNGYESSYRELGFENRDNLSFENYLPMRSFLNVEIPKLKTRRLVLEPQAVDHAEKIFIPFQNPNLYPYITREPLESAKQLREGIESMKNRMLPDKSEFCLNWVLFNETSKEYVGQVEVSLPINSKSFYLAYTVFEGHWRKGFAKEACLKVIEYMFEAWAAKKCIIEMDTRNIASIKLAESLGADRVSFKPKAQKLKGEWSDEFVYELRKKHAK